LKNSDVVSTKGGLVNEPLTSPEVDEAPNTPVVVNALIVAVLPCSGEPPRRSKAKNPDMPASGVVLIDTLNVMGAADARAKLRSAQTSKREHRNRVFIILLGSFLR